MSDFKYQWQLGDEFKRKPDAMHIHGIVGRVIESGIIQREDSHRRPWLCLRTNRVSWFHISYPANIKPRGKKTKARYAAAKAKWESEQVEFAVSQNVVCDGTMYDKVHQGHVYTVSSFQRGRAHPIIFLSGLVSSYDASNFRPATPAEIKAHELSLKTVWNLADGDQYWSLNHKGEIDRFTWDGTLSDCVKARERGLAFMTKDAAKAADQKRVDEVAKSREVAS